MKILEKLIWCDGDVTSTVPESLFSIGDPCRLGRGRDRIDIIDLPKQEIFGFGGAFTESSAVNYVKLDAAGRKKVCEDLFGEKGLRYNFCRVCINSSDFATGPYWYTRDADYGLSSFSIKRDKRAVIPFIKDALAASPDGIFLFASPWSPPAYMKTSGSMIGGSLKPECYRLWAEYFLRFIEEYEKEGIVISAVTTQNEPGSHRWESCEWTDGELAKFTGILSEVFSEYHREIKILCWDYNRGGMFGHVRNIYSSLGDRVWGAGFHWYNGDHAGQLLALHEAYPDKALIETEFCHGLSARMYGKYRREILNSLDRYANAVVEWNLLLDGDGGPYHSRDIGCSSPVMLRGDGVRRSNTYYQSYMFSHFIRRGARALFTSSAFPHVRTFAAKNPDGKLLIYTLNDSQRDEALTYRIGKYGWQTEAVAGLLTLYVVDPEGEI